MDSTSSTKNYCIAVDGSQYADWAFELVLDELYKKGDKITVVHITNSAKISEIPFAYQPKTIISKYDAKLTGKLASTDFRIITQERDTKATHALMQVYKIALSNNCTLLAMGFYGHKATNKNELTKGITYAIDNIRLPTIVVKENHKRKDKDSGSFTWMAAIETANTLSFKAFQFALNYIDLSKDKIIGTHIKLYNDSMAKEVKNYFEKTCLEKNSANFYFSILNNDRNLDIGNQLSNFVNYNETESIDFAVMGHNVGKYSKEGNNSISPLVPFIKSAKCNIIFYN
jgi:nucleotide-binding universal stress UspA family protein